ncbi:MAG TPA: hypothetical protein VN663_22900 [Ramlibacter sp.]|nr:hypothetical protein [Ramlibacter sp.]
MSPSGEELNVSNFAGIAIPTEPDIGIALVIDLSTRLGQSAAISQAAVSLLSANGADATPGSRLFGQATIIDVRPRTRQAIRQVLVNLVAGGQYVAWISVGTATGQRYTFVAPFTVA